MKQDRYAPDLPPPARTRRTAEAPTLELVLKRNSVERLKREKSHSESLVSCRH